MFNPDDIPASREEWRDAFDRQFPSPTAQQRLARLQQKTAAQRGRDAGDAFLASRFGRVVVFALCIAWGFLLAYLLGRGA